jgi:putative ABC transport system ATP-binding protein
MNASAQPLIRLDGIKKVFYTDEVETHALAGIHLEIQQGEYVAIAGPSGCGKSTLLAILGLLDTPSEGAYTLNGNQVANLSLSERARVRNREIGFIFQSFNLIGDLTVFENVELPLIYRGMKSAERRERANAASTCRRSSPAVSSSAWPWRAPLAVSPPSCWRTSRPETSIRKTAKR